MFGFWVPILIPSTIYTLFIQTIIVLMCKRILNMQFHPLICPSRISNYFCFIFSFCFGIYFFIKSQTDGIQYIFMTIFGLFSCHSAWKFFAHKPKDPDEILMRT